MPRGAIYRHQVLGLALVILSYGEAFNNHRQFYEGYYP